jgi:hypothetical protein
MPVGPVVGDCLGDAAPPGIALARAVLRRWRA